VGDANSEGITAIIIPIKPLVRHVVQLPGNRAENYE
jgi:hypothetical protein